MKVFVVTLWQAYLTSVSVINWLSYFLPLWLIIVRTVMMCHTIMIQLYQLLCHIRVTIIINDYKNRNNILVFFCSLILFNNVSLYHEFCFLYRTVWSERGGYEDVFTGEFSQVFIYHCCRAFTSQWIFVCSQLESSSSYTDFPRGRIKIYSIAIETLIDKI